MIALWQRALRRPLLTRGAKSVQDRFFCEFFLAQSLVVVVEFFGMMNNVQSLKGKVLKCAYTTLEKEGIGQIRMRNLAQDVGCSVGTLYNLFSGIEEICFHLNLYTFERLVQTLCDQLDKATAKHPEIEQCLPIVGWAYIRFGQENSFAYRALFETPPQGKKPLWYEQKIEALGQEAIEFVAKTFSIELEKGALLMSYFWFAIHGVSSIVLNKRSVHDSEGFIRSYVEHCLRGIYTQIN